MLEKIDTRTAAEYTAGAMAGAITSAAGGALIANTLFPATVNLAEGIAVQASMELGKTDVVYGPTDFKLPHAVFDTVLGHAGIHANITEFNVPLNSRGLSELVGLASQFHTAVQEPIQHAVIERLAVGGGIGGAIGVGLGVAAVHKLKQRGLPERARTFSTSFKNKFNQHPLRTIGAAGLSAAALFGCADRGYNLMSNEVPAGPSPTLMSSFYPNNTKMLGDATVSGTGGYLAKTLVGAGETYVKTVDRFWQQSASRFNTAFSVYEKGAGRKYANNKNIVPIMQLSDLHCTYPAYKYYLPTVIQKFQPSIIVNNGDTYTNSGTMPYEKNCASDFIKQAVGTADQENKLSSPTPVIGVTGNHDPKQSIPGIITLNNKNNYTTTVDSITFVGADYPIQTIWSTQPDGELAYNKAITQEGDILAKKACEITKNTGEPPVVLAHSVAEAYETGVNGCASIIDTGHSHREGAVEQSVGPNGNTVLWHTAGTATGANIGFTIYETPQLPATLMMQYFNKQTRKFAGFTTLSLTSAGNVSITTQEVPDHIAQSTRFDSANAKEFLRLFYSKTWKPQAP